MIKPGDRFERNGVQVTVHFVDAKQVYGVRYRLPINEVAVQAAIEAGEWPPGLLGPFRMDIADFEREVEDAKDARAADQALRSGDEGRGR